MSPSPLAPHQCLADSQFDFPGRAGGWHYFTLSPSNEFGEFAPDPAFQHTATPQSQLTCDDPDARIGRDHVHPGYQCRPGLQWHPPSAGSYCLEGEVALLRSRAHGRLNVRVFIDDQELLSATLNFPDTLRFRITSHVRSGGFIRVLFSCHERIDNNHTLYYLRIHPAASPCLPGQPEVVSECCIPRAWAELSAALPLHGAAVSPADAQQLAHTLYHPTQPADPALQALALHLAHRAQAADHPSYRQPRFFSIQPLPPLTPHAPS